MTLSNQSIQHQTNRMIQISNLPDINHDDGYKYQVGTSVKEKNLKA